LAKTGVCATLTDRRVERQEQEREDAYWITGDTWLFVIGCLIFYHFINLNSIILLQIIFLPKFMIFFVYK